MSWPPAGARPRFAKLAPAQQQAITTAALDEFAARGFHAASLNRVIEAAGISKGSMYYYFDGKEALYAHVVRVALARFFAGLAPFPIPGEGEPDGFWTTLTAHAVRLMTALAASPQLAALLRGWVAVAANPALQPAQREMEQAVVPWLEQALAAGQAIGAVRTDLPAGLLIAVVAGMGQAMDVWLLTQQPDTAELPRLVDVLIGMIRRALEP
jgi:AcrR family transcriptional regulator